MTDPTDPKTVTALLAAWRGGDERAADELMPVVYAELRRLARRYMRGERRDHTLQTTALVHEAYVRLVGSDVEYEDRRHFFAVAARSMRRVLVDHARARGRQKRGGRQQRLQLDEALVVSAEPAADLVALDEALDRLAAVDERKARAVELHYFGGLSYEETAEALAISSATVHRDLRMAKAWLREQLEAGGDGGS